MARSRNNALEFSSAGSIIVSTSSSDVTTSGSFGAIQFLKDSTFGSSEAVISTNVHDPDLSAPDNLNSQTFGAGTIIYGNFTSVKINNGVVALHRV
jgi:hypothetical protein|tara:strand:+ start:3074 stop:3361 length:288 start_codon:yes stop_codon:yes gene_type:complete